MVMYKILIDNDVLKKVIPPIVTELESNKEKTKSIEPIKNKK